MNRPVNTVVMKPNIHSPTSEAVAPQNDHPEAVHSSRNYNMEAYLSDVLSTRYDQTTHLLFQGPEGYNTNQHRQLAKADSLTLQDMAECKSDFPEKDYSDENDKKADAKRVSQQNLNGRDLTSHSGNKIATESLVRIKLNIIEQIDLAIAQFESKQVDRPPIGGAGGDRCTKMVQFPDVMISKTDSFTQTKSNIRLKLLSEIETILKRLKDIELLE
ncbi:uncharacterized protein LOC129780234 [Toxorhynchites rutilus septentrionalis]|uniref:uncharacterized protein LOC129780234 n=1 Tax=Toxorhynchites rutilus septentrionalis TaxID=329112 RepID=UPI002478B42F|nr:uncharacterized protein LOC129780234 [Toxorhynchites rutilus septentrionalis]